MPCTENGIAILAAILVIVHQTKPIFKQAQEIEESNPYMKFGRNQVINGYGKCSKISNTKK